MELRGYLTALRKGWHLILVTAVLGALTGWALFLATPTVYASNLSLYVSTPLTNSANPQSAGLYAQARVNSYVVLLKSERLGAEVARTAGVDLSPREIASRITPQAQQDTVVIDITVNDSSPERALAIAQGVASTFGRMVAQLDNQGQSVSPVVINVISGPTDASVPVAPKLDLHLGLGLLAGVVAGAVIALLRDLLDVSVRTPESAVELSGAPVLGNISFDPGAKRSPLLTGARSTSAMAESLRQVRTGLEFLGATRDVDVVVVTSALPLEGKSTTAANLALVLSELDSRVLLVDADLRRPRAADLLGVEGSLGLTNVLVGTVEVDDAIQPFGSTGLDFLASGSIPPNPAELLASERMRDLVLALRGRYDKVIIDTPPLLPVTDAAVAAELADGVLLVVRHAKTSRAQLRTAADTLRALNTNLLGTVLNMRRSGRTERKLYGYSSHSAGRWPGTGDAITQHPGDSGSLPAMTASIVPAHPRTSSKVDVSPGGVGKDVLSKDRASSVEERASVL